MIRRSLGRLFKRALGGVGILVYHRISDEAPDPQLLCVSPLNFEQHLEYLKQRYRVIGLQEVPELLKEKRRPNKVVVLTFDDGYGDNYWNAYPILERHGLRATIFVVTRYIDQACELVHDEVERLILTTPRLPEEITVEVDGTVHKWRLGDDGPQMMPWDVTRPDYPTLRHRCYHDLHRLLQGLSYEARSAALDALRTSIQDPPAVRGSRRPLTSSELCQLSKKGLVTIGAHSHSHLFLAKQSKEMQMQEIAASKHHLEEILGVRVMTFAYPYGGSEAVSETTRSCVEETGFELACDNLPGRVRRRTEPLLLPRFLVRNWSGEEFSGRLKHIFGE